MVRKLATGNHVAGHVLALAGEANRGARGCAGGAYPITPQTEVVEYLRAFPFSKGEILPVESEHSAMAVCIGAALAGARSFTASSANGLAYMTENVFAAGFYRLPILLVAVNRTLGPPWNIWADQGDSLALRDAAWVQFYCESHQEVADTILLAFRVAEDRRVLLPALVAYDGFIISHTTTDVELPEQEEVDRYLPLLDLPHRLDHEHPATIGGLAWPRETEALREDLEAAMGRVPAVLDEARREFQEVFGRLPDGAVAGWHLEEADTVLVCSGSMVSTAREVVARRRRAGERVGLLKVKLFRPFPRAAVARALAGARRVGVVDRNVSPGSGGIFGHEVAVTLRGRPGVLVQDYVVGLGGGDVTPQVLAEVLADLTAREAEGTPVWFAGGAV